MVPLSIRTQSHGWLTHTLPRTGSSPWPFYVGSGEAADVGGLMDTVLACLLQADFEVSGRFLESQIER